MAARPREIAESARPAPPATQGWIPTRNSRSVVNLTRDDYADNNPQVSPDGKLVVYERRISGHTKIYAFPLEDPAHKTQLTFGPFDDAAPVFSTDGTRLYYFSNEDDDIPNLRSLDLQTGEIAQYTHVFGGAMAPAPLKTPRGERLAFITYYKGEYLLHTKDTAEPIKEVEQEVQAAAEGLVDFQPDVTHEVVPENKRRKGLFEGLYLEGRPPINVGVTSSGNFYGGTAIALTDVLGDQLFSFTVLSVSSYRIYDGRYTNLASRLHYGVNFFDQTYFFYPYWTGYTSGYYYGGDVRDLAMATQRFTGGQVFAEYPLDTFRRLEFGAGVIKVEEQYENQELEQEICQESAILGLPCRLHLHLPARPGVLVLGGHQPARADLHVTGADMANDKPKVGIIGLTGCAGDQLQILNCEDELVRLAQRLHIVDWVMAKSDNDHTCRLDIAFVEGVVATERDLETLKEVRARARVLVALGTCAVWGGLPAMQNAVSREVLQREVYHGAANLDTVEALPPSHFVPFELLLPGCPIERHEFLRAVNALLAGTTPELPRMPVCWECKGRENASRVVHFHEVSCGAMTRGGCGARFSQQAATHVNRGLTRNVKFTSFHERTYLFLAT